MKLINLSLTSLLRHHPLTSCLIPAFLSYSGTIGRGAARERPRGRYRGERRGRSHVGVSSRGRQAGRRCCVVQERPGDPLGWVERKVWLAWRAPESMTWNMEWVCLSLLLFTEVFFIYVSHFFFHLYVYVCNHMSLLCLVHRVIFPFIKSFHNVTIFNFSFFPVHSFPTGYYILLSRLSLASVHPSFLRPSVSVVVWEAATVSFRPPRRDGVKGRLEGGPSFVRGTVGDGSTGAWEYWRTE